MRDRRARQRRRRHAAAESALTGRFGRDAPRHRVEQHVLLGLRCSDAASWRFLRCSRALEPVHPRRVPRPEPAPRGGSESSMPRTARARTYALRDDVRAAGSAVGRSSRRAGTTARRLTVAEQCAVLHDRVVVDGEPGPGHTSHAPLKVSTDEAELPRSSARTQRRDLRHLVLRAVTAQALDEPPEHEIALGARAPCR